MKRENLFDSINENFFRILTGQNKRFYADCLIELHGVSIFTDAADFDRERVNQIISNCMEWYADTLAEENTSDEDDKNALPGQEKMNTRCPPTKDSVFRKLLTCGWIDADFDDQTRRQLVSFTAPALTIVPELKRMAQPSRISLGGYTWNIIENLKAVMTARHPYQDAFVLALNNTYQFMQEMAKIRISIKSEVETILRCKNLEEMTSMLSAYLDSYLNGDYYKLQFAENLTAVERKQITGLLMDIENNEAVFQKLIEGAMDYMSIDSEEDANLLILRSVETIRCRLCDEYERQYREIQKNQARYVNNAAGRMPMLIADKKDTDSTINRLVLAISECDDEVYKSILDAIEPYNDQINLAPGFFTLSQYSLSKCLLIELGKLYCGSGQEKTMSKLLNQVHGNFQLFPKQISTPFQWEDDPTRAPEVRITTINMNNDLAEAKKQLESMAPIVTRLKSRRDTSLVHNDPKYFHGKLNPIWDFPISIADVNTLIYFAAGFCNKMLSYLDGRVIAYQSQNADDLNELLEKAL